MKVVYWLEPYPTTITKSIFLAGPTARQGKIPSWRQSVIKELKRRKWDGVVFIPEPRPGTPWPTKRQHDEIVDWEIDGLNRADCILFWVPRSKDKLPGFTTNIEWGEFFKSGRVVLGCPKSAIRMNYMKYRGRQFGVPFAGTLGKTLTNAIRLIGDGYPRFDAGRFFPSYVWARQAFQDWYRMRANSARKIISAKILWSSVWKYPVSFDFIIEVQLRKGRSISTEQILFTNESYITFLK